MTAPLSTAARVALDCALAVEHSQLWRTANAAESLGEAVERLLSSGHLLNEDAARLAPLLEQLQQELAFLDAATAVVEAPAAPLSVTYRRALDSFGKRQQPVALPPPPEALPAKAA